MSETDRDLVLVNTKLAINMIKLAGYAVDKMYTGWLLVGHTDVVKYCVHCFEMVQDHSVYWNLYRAVAHCTWRGALYVVTVGRGDGLNAALYYLSDSSGVIFNEVGMDSVMCSQVFKALSDVLLAGAEYTVTGEILLERTATLVGKLLSVKSPHTRKVLMGLLVYKPSMTAWMAYP